MKQKLLNISANGLKRKNLIVMVNKVASRVTEKFRGAKQEDILAWCEYHAEPYDVYLKKLDERLWEETQSICSELQLNAIKKLENLDFDLGGGGNYHLLYFMSRFVNAETVVETGVAAGWSSQALLTALKNNQEENNVSGNLYSSDFPYFRLKNPEKYVGYVVDENLKNNWVLYIEGDKYNLPKISRSVQKIDLFHYDSDKSYEGRQFAYETLSAKFTPKTIIIFDDIQDNFYFRDWTKKNNKPFKVFKFESKYVGLANFL